MGLFVINALLIVGWNILFFSNQLMSLAFVQAVILIVNLLFLVVLIWRFSPLAASLLLPYSGWVIFSTALTYNVWMLN